MTADSSTAILSPCIEVCRLNEHTGLCEGCWRSLDEISDWRSASEADRREILRRVALRRAQAGSKPASP